MLSIIIIILMFIIWGLIYLLDSKRVTNNERDNLLFIWAIILFFSVFGLIVFEFDKTKREEKIITPIESKDTTLDQSITIK